MAITTINMNPVDISPQYFDQYLPAKEGFASVTASISLDGVTYTTGVTTVVRNSRYNTLSLPDAAATFLLLSYNLPSSYVSGTPVILTIIWTSSAITGNCRFNVGMTRVSSSTGTYTQDADTDITYAGIANYTAPTAVNKLVKTELTFSGTDLVAGGYSCILIGREGANAADTMAGPMYLVGVSAKFQINKPSS